MKIFKKTNEDAQSYKIVLYVKVSGTYQWKKNLIAPKYVLLNLEFSLLFLHNAKNRNFLALKLRKLIFFCHPLLSCRENKFKTIFDFQMGPPSLYEGVSVRRSDGWSDGWSVTCFFSNAKNGQFSLGKSSGQSKFDIDECAECSECA